MPACCWHFVDSHGGSPSFRRKIEGRVLNLRIRRVAKKRRQDTKPGGVTVSSYQQQDTKPGAWHTGQQRWTKERRDRRLVNGAKLPCFAAGKRPWGVLVGTGLQAHLATCLVIPIPPRATTERAWWWVGMLGGGAAHSRFSAKDWHTATDPGQLNSYSANSAKGKRSALLTTHTAVWKPVKAGNKEKNKRREGKKTGCVPPTLPRTSVWVGTTNPLPSSVLF